MSVQHRKTPTSSMLHVMLLLMLCKISLRRKLQSFPGKMVNTLHADEEKGIQDKESKEESILAMLGIIGTILNLVVIIFVYIYTTL
ncbi:protein TUNAR-like [Pungitius pungitius]|uniref:protein TUNAR-like n=1 Tax=Pungitius pungitius TaxID=134920 RepID=UPI002E111D5A